MSINEDTIKKLRDHPDAKRTAGDGDKAREVGLQSVSMSAKCEVRILWHWGVVTFGPDEQERLANYLRQ